uniref:Uncharacterized protein n=1 Tax=Anguilla anguilla TaxID=7936 RepID=A0A0E9X1X4_ANGAN
MSLCLLPAHELNIVVTISYTSYRTVLKIHLINTKLQSVQSYSLHYCIRDVSCYYLKK